MTNLAIVLAIMLAFFALKFVKGGSLLRKLPSPSNWWQAGLLYGTAMFLLYAGKHAIRGDLTLSLLGRDFLVWEAAGAAFGIILTAVMSVFFHRNFFRGFPDKRGNR